MWDDVNHAYSDCEDCRGTGMPDYCDGPCERCMVQRFAELEGQRDTLAAALRELLTCQDLEVPPLDADGQPEYALTQCQQIAQQAARALEALDAPEDHSTHIVTDDSIEQSDLRQGTKDALLGRQDAPEGSESGGTASGL